MKCPDTLQVLLYDTSYLEDVGVQVDFILGQAFIHAAHFDQRVSERCLLRLQLVEQQTELCIAAFSLVGRREQRFTDGMANTDMA